MDPEGAARGTGPGDERRRALQLREHVPGVGALREDGGERGGDLVADTDGGEHIHDIGGQLVEDLAGEVVREVGVSGEVTEQHVGVGATRRATGLRRPGPRPSPRSAPTGGRAGRGSPGPGRGEQGRRFVPGEREVARAQVDDLLTQPEAVEPAASRRIVSRAPAAGLGPVAKERGQPVQRVRCGDGVDVVEDQRDRSRRREGVDDRATNAGPGSASPAAAAPGAVRARHSVERREQGPAQKRSSASSSASRVTQAPARSASQVGEELRLAEPGGRTDHDDLSGCRAVQHPGQSRPGEEGRGDAGRVDFAGDTTGHPATSTRRTLRPPRRPDQYPTRWSSR